MAVDPELLDILVCPKSKGELELIELPQDVRATLAGQIGHSVRWLDSILFLLDQGVDTFEEVGPGNVLTKLVLRIRKARG